MSDHEDEMSGWWFTLVMSIIFLIGIAFYYSTPPMELVEVQFPPVPTNSERAK